MDLPHRLLHANLRNVGDVMSETQVQDALTHLPEWSGDAQGLRRSVEFTTFPAAIEAVVRIADEAEQRNHHPDIDIRWRTVTFVVRTHSAGGVTQADLELAEAISGLLR